MTRQPTAEPVPVYGRDQRDPQGRLTGQSPGTNAAALAQCRWKQRG